MVMALIVMIALSVMAFMQWKKRELMRIEWNKVSSFLAFMAFFTAARISGYDFLVDQDPSILWELQNSPLATLPVWRFFLVFWEDVFFGMSIYWIMSRFKDNKYIWLPAVSAISILFGMAHGYQGAFAIMLTTFYPYFISYKLGKKYGFGTVQVCHILYDMITYYTILMMPYLV